MGYKTYNVTKLYLVGDSIANATNVHHHRDGEKANLKKTSESSNATVGTQRTQRTPSGFTMSSPNSLRSLERNGHTTSTR